MIDKNYSGYLIGANPRNPLDEWTKSVTLIVSHTQNITVGIQVNKPYIDLTLSSIALKLGIEQVPADPIYIGGDEYPSKVHIIHSLDWQGLTTVPLNDWIGVTNDVSILSAMAIGDGPEWTRACSGFRVWENGEFDLEISTQNSSKNMHSWVLAPGNIVNMFSQESDAQWQLVLEESAKFAVDIWFAD